MSEKSELKAVCRCCHTQDMLKAFNRLHENNEIIEIYSEMLHETFGLTLQNTPATGQYTICKTCILQLEAANQFKKQVEQCEAKLGVCQKNSFNCKVNESEMVKLEPGKCEEDEDLGSE
ncbi:unnamed protein product [Danaus chrysippus]|uniref:(African queen) hypothetical protein n=1 Tax=Danaus chrysippus TaxID=151541 RepID=A0A8J2R1X1_9NEOP|nr:unnamed protein product [Danaus chrysippus]